LCGGLRLGVGIGGGLLVGLPQSLYGGPAVGLALVIAVVMYGPHADAY
jgi:hypothetical protein